MDSFGKVVADDIHCGADHAKPRLQGHSVFRSPLNRRDGTNSEVPGSDLMVEAKETGCVLVGCLVA